MRIALLVCLSLMVAGCASEPASDEPPTEIKKEVEATSTTGGIRGVIVDPTITPIAGVTVTVVGADKSTETDADGEFVVSGLEPGIHNLIAEHILYNPVQQTAIVEAGVTTPKAVRILMERNAVSEPILVTQTFDGHIKCSTNLMLVAYSEECGEGVGSPRSTCSVIESFFGNCMGAPNVDNPVMPGERIGRTPGSSPQVWFRADQAGPATIIVEQNWRPSLNLATGNTAAFYTRVAYDWFCDPVCHGNSLGAVTAESPLYLRVDQEVLAEHNVTEDTDLSTFTYSGADNGVIIEQPFEQFVTFTWGLPAPDGWSFINQDPYPF